jgi:Tfp pilus assembly protein PilF
MYVLTDERPPFMTSRSEPGVARIALAYRDQASRDIAEPSPQEQAARDAEINSALDQAVSYLSVLPDSPAYRFERAAKFLAAGRLDDARNLIAGIEQEAGESAATLNLRAAINLTEAYELTAEDQANELRTAARELLQRAMQLDPNDPRAWFNMALLEEDLGNTDAARVAWREYLTRETDEALQAVVRSSREL